MNLSSFKVKRAHEVRDNQLLFENIQNELFEIVKIVRNNSWTNSKINNMENSTTPIILLCWY